MSYRKRESWYTNEQRKERHERKKRVQGKEKKKKKEEIFFFFKVGNEKFGETFCGKNEISGGNI